MDWYEWKTKYHPGFDLSPESIAWAEERIKEIELNMKSNGCNEDGWDLYEEQTRQDFEYYVVRRGYSVVRDSDYNFFYAEQRTADAWEMYHQGHVKGRGWKQ